MPPFMMGSDGVRRRGPEAGDVEGFDELGFWNGNIDYPGTAVVAILAPRGERGLRFGVSSEARRWSTPVRGRCHRLGRYEPVTSMPAR